MQPTAKQTIIPNKKLRIAVTELGCAVILVASIFMTQSPDANHFYAWACTVLFGLSFILLLPQLFGKNYLLLDEQGFRAVSPYNKKFTFAWSDIESVGTYPIKVRYGRPVEMIGFNLKNPGTGVVGAITAINESNTKYQRAFANSYKMSSQELVRLMEQYRLGEASAKPGK